MTLFTVYAHVYVRLYTHVCNQCMLNMCSCKACMKRLLFCFVSYTCVYVRILIFLCFFLRCEMCVCVWSNYMMCSMYVLRGIYLCRWIVIDLCNVNSDVCILHLPAHPDRHPRINKMLVARVSCCLKTYCIVTASYSITEGRKTELNGFPLPVYTY